MARRPGAVTRERRLQAVSAWLDKPDALAAEFAAGETTQRIRTFSQAAPDDLVAALDLLGRLKGVGIVVHGPRGCAAALVGAAPLAHWAVTGLDQRDTIMGSEGVVERAVLALVRRHEPWAVFVVTTPVVAINADDARDTVLSLTDELGIPVQLVRTDGFKSRVAATGFDAACQALLNLVPAVAEARQDDLVNVVARDAAAARASAALLEELGLKVNVLPAGADAEGFARAARARLSICVDPDATMVFAAALEAAHGVPVLRAGVPIGLAATRRWLDAVAAAAGQASAGILVAPPYQPAMTRGWKRAAASDKDGAAERALHGVRVHLALPADAVFAAAELVTELGGVVAGVTVGHIDSSHAEALDAFTRTHPGVTLHVAAGQPFELVNLLAKQCLDLFMGTPELAALAAAAGVPAVGLTPAALIGWRGAARLAERARAALTNPAFFRRLSAAPSPYAAGWLRRSADWHVKQEVR
nr:nitrogenase component 1 [uncultured Rhodopila sp.]